MPAIHPARLKKQVIDLVAKFDQPASFVRDLHALLDFYTDYTQRPGQSGLPISLQDTYNAPPQVMRQVWHELKQVIEKHADESLPLCDALWAEQNYDMQILAARLLGQLPLSAGTSVITRLQSWMHSNPDKRLLDGVLEHVLLRLQREDPNQLLELIGTWLSSGTLNIQHAGLRGLLPIINAAGNPMLPGIYRLVTPYLRVAQPRLRPDIVAVVSALAHCSASETAYILRQNLTAPDNPDTPWLIRQVLDEFPEEMRIGLRIAMKNLG